MFDELVIVHVDLAEGALGAAEDLAGDIRAYTGFAARAAGEEDPEGWLREAIRERLFARLDEHGCRPDPEWRSSILDTDIQLNAAGLMVWMQRQQR